MRRTFSKLPSCVAIFETGYRLKAGGLDLPQRLVEPPRTDGEVAVAESLQLGDAAKDPRPVDGQRPLAADDGQLDLLALDVLGQLDHLDPARRDRPQLRAAAHGLGAVRWLERERVGQRHLFRLAQQRPVGQDDELGAVAFRARSLGRGHFVPAARAGDAVDADLAPVRARVEIGLRRPDEAALLGELDVQRLTTEQAQGSSSTMSGSGASTATFPFVLCAGLRWRRSR